MKSYILLSLIIVSSLINWAYFGSSTLAAYFFYTIAIAITCVYACFDFFKIKQPLTIAYPLPTYLFLCLAFFYTIHSCLNGHFDVKLFLLIGNCFFFLLVSLLLSINAINVNAVYKIISLVAFIESVVCICQYIGILPSLNIFFPVTGTWENPNVIAIFLAMTLPATFSLLLNTAPKVKYLVIIVLAFIGIAIIILKCRTAYIGSIISIVMVLNFYYQPVLKLQSHLKSIKLLVIAVAIIICLSLLLLSLYKMKMASADGRLLIWKISLDIIPHHLLAGVGLGNFEQVYNLQQADYFNNGVFTKVEIENASFVNILTNVFFIIVNQVAAKPTSSGLRSNLAIVFRTCFTNFSFLFWSRRRYSVGGL